MADESSVVPIWCDVGKNMNAVSLIVSLGNFTKRAATNAGRSKQVVRICARKLMCDNHEDADCNQGALKNTTVCYPDSFSVIPRSCSGLSANKGRNIQMRLQFQYHIRDHQENMTKKHLKKELNELRNGCHSICCRMCGSVVRAPERPFKRVLELPSENWLELAQDWCCHGSSHLTSVAGALEPGEDDCFVGEHYIKVHPATVAADNLQILPGEELHLLKCCRCNAILGNVMMEDASFDLLEFINVSSVHFYKHRISLTYSNLFRSYCTETYISSCLISKSQGAVNFRFLVQEPMLNGHRRTHACLWLFNADAATITNIELKNWDSLSGLDKTGLYSVTNKGKYLRVLKILYKIKTLFSGSNWDHEVTSWQENPSVQSLTLTEETCLDLILLLIKSTNTIAPSLRDVNGFKVGYLRLLDS